MKPRMDSSSETVTATGIRFSFLNVCFPEFVPIDDQIGKIFYACVTRVLFDLSSLNFFILT